METIDVRLRRGCLVPGRGKRPAGWSGTLPARTGKELVSAGIAVPSKPGAEDLSEEPWELETPPSAYVAQYTTGSDDSYRVKEGLSGRVTANLRHAAQIELAEAIEEEDEDEVERLQTILSQIKE